MQQPFLQTQSSHEESHLHKCWRLILLSRQFSILSKNVFQTYFCLLRVSTWNSFTCHECNYNLPTVSSFTQYHHLHRINSYTKWQKCLQLTKFKGVEGFFFTPFTLVPAIWHRIVNKDTKQSFFTDIHKENLIYQYVQ